MLILYMSLTETDEGKTLIKTIYEDYRKLVFYIAFQYTENNDTAEDIVHEVFLIIIEQINKNKIRASSSSEMRQYICVLTKNCAISYIKKSLRETGFSGASISEEQAFGEIYAKDIVECIQNMPEAYRSVLELTVYNDLSVKQISKILGVSQSTVRKRIAKSHDIIKNFLK